MSALFDKKIEPRCVYCARGSALGEHGVVCPKKGIVPVGSHCRCFRYDPLKRIPPLPSKPDFSHLKDEDFAL